MTNLDIYEVERADYLAYWFRLPHNDLMKTTPEEGLTIWKDTKTGDQICGTKVEQIIGTAATQYYIITLMDEERLGAEKTTKYISMTEEDYKDLITQLSQISASWEKNND